MDRYGMLEHIRDHSIVVEKVASLIARGLVEAGESLSLRKVTAGALLHDIAKTPCLGTGQDHAAKGEEICLQNRLDEIADIVGEHVHLRGYSLTSPVVEKEIVYYADKRVNHNRVVSLEERLNYLIDRYGGDEREIHRLIRDNFELCKALEKKLFAKLAFAPDALPDLVD
jgi:putative nucleotidyltransferase with HDIG domain